MTNIHLKPRCKTQAKPASTFAALAAAAALAACGPGAEPPADPATSEISTPSEADAGEPQALIHRKLQLALAIGQGKTVLQVGGSRGLFGSTLAEDGWRFIQADLANLPKNAETVLYINASDSSVDAAVLRQKLKGFAGVLLIDSARTVAAPGAGGDAAEEDAPYASADLLHALSEGQVKATPLATALVIGRASGFIMGIKVAADGTVNGADKSERQVAGFNPLLALADNAERARAAAAQPERARALRETYAAWDMRLNFAELNSGWHTIGEVYVDAYFTEVGARRHFLHVRVDTGNKLQPCETLAGVCGVYPMNKNSIVFTPEVDPQLFGSQIPVIGSADRYTAYAQAYPARGIVTSVPSLSSPALLEEHDFDHDWSDSLDFVGTLGRSGTAQLSFASGHTAVTLDTRFRKHTDRWRLESKRETTVNGDPNRVKSSVSIYANSRDYWDTVVTNDQFRHPSVTGAGPDAGRKQFREMFLLGEYCKSQSITATGGPGPIWWFNAGEGLRRSKLSYEGWNPHISTVFEIDSARIMSRDAHSFVDVRAGVVFTRPEFLFERSNNARCMSTDGVNATSTASRTGYTLVGRAQTRDGYRWIKPGKWREYDAFVNVRVNHTHWVWR